MRALHSISCMQCCTHSGLPCGAFFIHISHSHAGSFQCTIAPHQLDSDWIDFSSQSMVWWCGRPRIRSSAAQRNVHCINCNKIHSYKMVLCRCNRTRCTPSASLSLSLSASHISGYQISTHASNSHKYALLTTEKKKIFCYQIHYPQIRIQISESTHISFRIDYFTSD